MKKIIIIALLFVFASQAQASTVAINTVQTEKCGVQEVVISGLSAYTGLDTTTTIEVDGDVVMVAIDSSWAVNYEATVGTHEVVAVVGTSTDTTSFEVKRCIGNGSPMNSACFAEDGAGSCYSKIQSGVVTHFPRGHIYCSFMSNGCVSLTKNLWMLKNMFGV